MSALRTLSRDTHFEAEAVQLRIYRQMPAWRKLELVEAANRTARQLVEAGVRSRHPGAADSEVRRRVLDLELGPALAARVYGPLPTDAAPIADGGR